MEDLESLLEDLKKEIEEKGLTFHRESLEKQRFYEEKYQKDFELLQKTANRTKKNQIYLKKLIKYRKSPVF